jgi:hypothetical protein
MYLLQFPAANSQVSDFSSPEAAWLSLIAALQTGNTDSVKVVCSAEGFQSLIEIISPFDEKEPFAGTFQTWGNKWAENEIEVFTVNNHASLIAVDEDDRKSFVFLYSEKGWKLHQWIKDF